MRASVLPPSGRRPPLGGTRLGLLFRCFPASVPPVPPYYLVRIETGEGGQEITPLRKTPGRAGRGGRHRDYPCISVVYAVPPRSDGRTLGRPLPENIT